MATIRIRELNITRDLDREAIVHVRGGQMTGLTKPAGKTLVPFFPPFWGNQYQNVAVNAVQMASNQGYGAINQTLGISVNANQG